MEPRIEKIRQWRELYDTRKELEEALSDVKKEEGRLTSWIMEDLHGTGQKGASYPDLGTVTIVERPFVSILDGETVARNMKAEMDRMQADGLPLVNAVWYQQRASQNKLIDMAEAAIAARGEKVDHNTLTAELKTMGFSYGLAESLHFAAPRGKSAA
jgi:hypothetical protein